MKKVLVIILILLFVAFIVYFFFLKEKEPVVQKTALSVQPDTLSIASFNIQFLGSFKKRDDLALATIIKNNDIVVVQELVAPPVSGAYPDGDTYKADPESAEFFDAMNSFGYSYILSEEDTGSKEKIHTAGTATEWFVTFYKQDKVKPATDLPNGFLAYDRSNHPNYERVPYAFAFRSANQNLDFVLVSVHLQPGDKAEEEERRKHELSSIATWIDENDAIEKDFIILGDMNIYSREELDNATPSGYLSLNDECRFTNTLAIDGSGQPYDHVLYNTTFSAKEIDLKYDLVVLDLVELMKPFWTSSDPYPGDPYDHMTFKQFYSDHNPVVFRMIAGTTDDD